MHLHPKEGQSSDVVSAFLPGAGKSLPNLTSRLAMVPAQYGGVVVNIGHDYEHRPGDIAEFLLQLLCLRGNQNVTFRGLNDSHFAQRLVEIMEAGPNPLYQYQNTFLAFTDMIKHCNRLGSTALPCSTRASPSFLTKSSRLRQKPKGGNGTAAQL